MSLSTIRLHESLNTIQNRFTFIDSIEKDISTHSHLSLMLVDVVRFSDVTTTFGMDAGDQILLEIANRIILLFKSKVRLGRISGDIFALVFIGKHSRTFLNNQYQYLVDHFKTPMYHDNHAFIADFNVGAVATSHGKFNLTEFIAKAEAALKQSKESKFENFHVLDMARKAETGRSLALKADLKRALEAKELELYLQPKVSLDSLEIVSAECLLRWNHPIDGVLFPGALIEAAESYNMSNELAYWTLEQAFKMMKTLDGMGTEISLSVNISPTQLYDNKLIPTLEALEYDYQIPLNRFELELTEDIALSNSLMVKKQLSHLKVLGVDIAIDDFGKGYSNLSYIRELEIDTLKIDKSFVVNIQNDPVNIAIIQAAQIIAKAKDCEVVAEGIETIEQLHVLRHLGISTGQGYLFSRALPLAKFIDLAFSDITIGTSPLRDSLSDN